MKSAVVVPIVAFALAASAAWASGTEKRPQRSVRQAVDAVIPALMVKDRIPGMAVAVTDRGRAVVLNYGFASVSPRVPMTDDTLFELGSISKTFTATLVSLAQVQHRLSLADTVERYLPQLRGSAFGSVTLVSLGTHTAGGLALQFPNSITNDARLMQYFRRWRPAYPMGAFRTYSNQGIGMLGFITAKCMGGDFRSLMQQRLFPDLGLHHSFIAIPAGERGQYAWGYTADDTPIRMKPGILADEAYGVRATASDVIRFVQENIDPANLPPATERAVTETHREYFRAGPMTQDLIWEQYPYPVTLRALLQGNSVRMIFEPTRVHAVLPPQPPQQSTWLNKTGSTDGFGAYVAFIPSKRLGVVLLANKNYPIADRVTGAYKILSALAR